MKVKTGKSALKSAECIYVHTPGSAKKSTSKSLEAGKKRTLDFFPISGEGNFEAAAILPAGKANSANMEEARNLGHKAFTWLISVKSHKASIVDKSDDSALFLCFVEGFLLASYQFLELVTKPKKKDHGLSEVRIVPQKSTTDLNQRVALAESVAWTRDLVNRPLSHLTAVDLAEAIKLAGKETGFNVEVLSKRKIESLKMGGLLAVNKGSIDPPTFTIAEWKPKNAVNKKPLILVGKGVVYDTGGMSLKPTQNSMDFMKSDMAGAAAMAGTIRAAAALKLPLHIITLIPATDNRPDGNAYVPGDVITMFDGTTVEVKNTDAEGRLLLADALAYAKKFDPELVFDAATLTGASVRSIGVYATSVMGTASEKAFGTLDKAGTTTYERVVRFPLWDEYGKELSSEVADMSNLGKGEAGQISAGKFLQHFTDYPWIHLDIAGPSFLHSPMTYRPKGGTGVGVRLLIEFMQKYYKL